MSNLLNDFNWKDYSVKHGLDTDNKCVEYAIRASVVDDSKKNTVLYLKEQFSKISLKEQFSKI